MPDSAKYLIHAAIAADGVVERSDVVGAVYGQTEGLLGEELDLRRLQESSKLGRIDVQMETSGGQSVGELTVATSLDRVETATLAAALETIDRVGPCRATVEVTDLEDVRAAKRRQVIDRAQRLLVEEFQETTSEAIVEEVRRRVATADVTTYEGLPAGPRVPDADALVVVEGRSDVQAVLAAGVKNGVAVEGTDVPEAVAELTTDRTTTAFMDGDRGGELILRELRQVGDVDYVAVAPRGESVEDLPRSQILAALRSKVAVEGVADATTASDLADAARARTSGGVVPEQGDPADTSAVGPGGDAADSTDSADPQSSDDAEPDDATDAASASGQSTPEHATASPAEPATAADDAPATADDDVATTAADDVAANAGDDVATTADDDVGATADDEVPAAAGDDTAPAAADADLVTAEPASDAGSTSDVETVDGDADVAATPDDASGAVVDDQSGVAAGEAVEAAVDETDGSTAPAESDAAQSAESDASSADPDAASPTDREAPADAPRTLRGHVEAVLGTGRARLLADDATELATVDADAAFETLEDADPAPAVLVLDDELGQRLLDLAAQCGVREVVAASLGEFTKRPTDVRIRTGEQLLAE